MQHRCERVYELSALIEEGLRLGLRRDRPGQGAKTGHVLRHRPAEGGRVRGRILCRRGTWSTPQGGRHSMMARFRNMGPRERRVSGRARARATRSSHKERDHGWTLRKPHCFAEPLKHLHFDPSAGVLVVDDGRMRRRVQQRGEHAVRRPTPSRGIGVRRRLGGSRRDPLGSFAAMSRARAVRRTAVQPSSTHVADRRVTRCWLSHSRRCSGGACVTSPRPSRRASIREDSAT